MKFKGLNQRNQAKTTVKWKKNLKMIFKVVFGLTAAGMVMGATAQATYFKGKLEQIGRSTDYIKDTMDLPLPESVPFFKVISRDTYETPNKQLTITPQQYQQDHLARIGPHADYEILEGNHFIYAGNTGRISEIVDNVLSQRDVKP